MNGGRSANRQPGAAGRMATRSAARQNLDKEHFALLANRTLRQRTPGEFLVPLPIVLGGGGLGSGGAIRRS